MVNRKVEFFKHDVMRRGAHKCEAVFGGALENMPTYESINSPTDKRQELDERQIRRQEDGLPEFIVRCVRKIDPMVSTVGIYRINGDAAAVQKIRYVFCI